MGELLEISLKQFSDDTGTRLYRLIFGPFFGMVHKFTGIG